ncbi:hypothetical protein CMI37_18035 [Candidatus Pacearchaeota archaeon]|nr:hypothetical protein [Candidatus Pacearchaeota archaeon]|tara:strand:+ start:642 stop:1406 length:765 start_codon:yes stop_codon:yes gene_type:complete
MSDKPRVVVWFSCGAASAVAAKLAVQEYGDRCVIAYCDTGGEHPSNKKFLLDVEKWVGRKILILKNKKGFVDHFDVYRKTKYIKSHRGAMCTVELKKKCRYEFQRPDDIHIFGYTVEEKERAKRFNEYNFELATDWILIRKDVSKEDCLGLLWKEGLEIPAMYLPPLEMNHNNCVGCVRGGRGYWNKIRVHFPEHFKTMSEIERELEYSLFKNSDGSPLYLDQLDPSAGNFLKEPPISCGLGCGIIAQELERNK